MRWPVAIAVAALLAPCRAAAASPVPTGYERALPSGFRVMAVARSRPDRAHDFIVVALAARSDRRDPRASPAPPRPLIVLRRSGGRYRQVARNDHIVLRSNEGGQCDPFVDGGITAKGRFITIEHNMACGQHWESTTTFRFDPRLGTFIFDNERYQSLKWNPDQRSDADALVKDIDHVERAGRRIVTLSNWRQRE
jgi:hypothetical protein